MHQILHIFEKDCRRFWPEILALLVVHALFAGFYPYQWRQHDATALNFLGIPIAHDLLGVLPSVLIALLPVTWLVLIGRVVQDEALVGDRQYWVTRPIPWRLLLTEKSLFLLLFLILPFTIAQVIVMAQAGFPILPNLPRTFLLVLIDAVSFMLPLFVLATLTRTFFRLSMTIVGLCAVLILVGAFGENFSGASSYTTYTDPISLPLFVITCVLVIMLQYASRTVWLARGLLCLSLLLVLTVAINPLEGRMLESTFYPLAPAHTLPVDLAIDSSSSRPITIDTGGRHPSMSIPVAVSGVPFGTHIIPENVLLTIESAGGERKTTNWQAVSGRRYLNSTLYGVVVVQLEDAMLAQLRHGPVTLRMQIALAQYELGDQVRIPVTEADEVALPGLGLCAIDAHKSLYPGLKCRMPLREPALMTLAAPWTTQPCSTGAQPDSAILSVDTGTRNPTPVDVSLTSVLVSSVSFALPASTDTNLSELPPVLLCAGSWITATPLQLKRRARVELPAFPYDLPQRYH